MKQRKLRTESDLKKGDRVKLLPRTPAWNAETTLQGKIGEVTECREDGRVSVLFEHGRLLMGCDSGQLERLNEVGLKVKGK
jgi:hypothetical protein